MNHVKSQYERFPYPPVGFLALPRRGQSERMAYETGMALTQQAGQSLHHKGKRILVAGAGTLEALVVARAHPYAREIVAVDLSAASIAQLKRRVMWSRVNDFCRLRWFKKLGALPLIRYEVADLTTWQTEPFDYIVASNILHHVEDPVALLKRLSSWLRPGGLLRLMTYPKQSRLWLRWVGLWLRLNGITQETSNLKSETKHVIGDLPAQHPIRLCYERHSETHHESGIVDAFLHACENPLSPLAWQDAVEASGLALLGEQQHYLSSSAWLRELVPQTAQLSSWQRLQVLDDLMEVVTNPIFWLQKAETQGKDTVTKYKSSLIKPFSHVDVDSSRNEDVLLLDKSNPPALLALQAGLDYRLPSLAYWQFRQGVDHAAQLLAKVDCSTGEVLDRIDEDVDRQRGSGLSLGNYSLTDIMNAREPWDDDEWKLAMACGLSLCYQGRCVPGSSLVEQAQWLQLYYGPFHSMLHVKFVSSSVSMF